MLKINSRGASIDDADLTPLLPRYRNFPKGDRRAELDKVEDPFDSYDMLRPVRDHESGATYRSMTTQEINILETGAEAPAPAKGSTSRPSQGAAMKEHPIDLSDRDWQVERRHAADRDMAVCTLVIESAGKPTLKLVKTYTLLKGQYDVTMDLKVESLDDRPHEVIVTQDGPVDIREIDIRNDSRKVYFASSVDKDSTTGKDVIKTGRAERKDTFGGSDKEKTPRPFPLPTPKVGGRLVWAALGNQYFAAIMTPVNAERKADFSQMEAAQAVHLTTNKGVNEVGDLSFRFVTKPTAVAPGKSADLRFDLYIGPKERNLFTDGTHHPSYVDRKYLGTILEEYSWCANDWLAEFMSKLLIGLHDYIWPHNWGLAIIILVLVVRVILHPLTKKGQVSMNRMQTKMADVAPKLDDLKKKYGNDKNKLNQETMLLYRKEGINPASNVMNCLPMMLQMPIWVALWASLSNTIELRHASFMIIPGRWILDLASPDAIYRFDSPVNLLFFNVDAINVLPFLWGISMALQQKFTPRPKPGRSNEQLEQQQRMMYIMSIVMTVMFYNFPSGLTLYIMASNFFGLVEQWRIRKHLEADQAHPAPVPVAADGGAVAPKSRGLFGKLMDRVEKFDQQQRMARSDKKK
jgi:YidC/Oxa1 family membrane protein insertase